MNDLDLIEKSMELYIRKWTKSGEYNDKKGYYTWMSEFIAPNSKVLEIGCGSGRSTYHLAKRCEYVVSIEENINCINSTFDYLNNLNIDVSKYFRFSEYTYDNDSNKYCKLYSDLSNLNIDNKVTLIEGDVVNDNSLLNYFNKQPKFDYIICWLLGTHTLKLYNDLRANPELSMGPDGIWNEEDYRWTVLNEIIIKYSKFLTKGGKIHIVDREVMPKSEKEFKLDIDDYERLLNISRDRLEFKYHEFKFNKGISYINTETYEKVTNDSLGELALISVIIHF